jgi:hypothetical protein
MLEDLERNCLSVTLATAPEPQHPTHMIRVADTLNADWYRDFCAAHESSAHPRRSRHVDTKIKRRNVISTLTCLINTGDTKSSYKDELCEIATRLYNEVFYDSY